MTISWDKLAERVGVSPSDMQTLRKNEDAPPTRSIDRWREYVAQFSTLDENELPDPFEYDGVVKRGKISYAESLTREKVREQIIINQKREIELDQSRSKLLTVAEFDAALVKQQDAFLMGLSKLPDIAAASFIKADQPDVKKKARQWIKEIRRLVHGAVHKK